MRKRIIRNLSLNLVIMQLFTQQVLSLVKNNKDYNYDLNPKISSTMKPKSSGKKIIMVEDDESPVYQREDDKTGDINPISIFDYDNIYYHQYGANQDDYRDHFDDLIQDPYIWEEIQKYYPITGFECEEDAMFFYKQYFYLIYDNGCGYAAAANYVFRLFEGKENEFFETFGYPMYKSNGKYIDFNYEIFMLKFFNYLNIDIDRNKKELEKAISRNFYEYKVDYYMQKQKDNRKIGKEFLNWTDEQRAEYHAFEREIEDKIKEYNEKYMNAPKMKDFNFGVGANDKFGYLYSYLRQFGVRIDSHYYSTLYKPSVDDIVASEGFMLYKVDQEGNVSRQEKVEYHYVYISEIKEDGIIIVSSWGNMYIFDNKEATKTEKILLQKSK